MSQMSALSVCIFLLSKNFFLLYQNVVALQVICPFEEHNWPVDSVLMKWNFYDFILSLSLGQMVLHILEHLWGHRGDSRPLDTKMEPKPCHTEKKIRQNVNYLDVFFYSKLVRVVALLIDSYKAFAQVHGLYFSHHCTHITLFFSFE